MAKDTTQYAVIGLGRFGEALAKKLYEIGKDVLVVDSDEDKVNGISNYVTHSIVADASDEKVLKSIGIKNFDVVVVCMGSNFQGSVLVTLMCKELGVKYVVAKAKTLQQKSVLSKIGADLVIFPEADMGEKLATMLTNRNLIDIMDLTDDISIIEIAAPKTWTGKTLMQLDIRRNYGLTVLLIKRSGGSVELSPSGDSLLSRGDTVIICGSNDDLAKFNKVISKITDSAM